MAGPKRPQDRVELPDVQKNFGDALQGRDQEASETEIDGIRSSSAAARW